MMKIYNRLVIFEILLPLVASLGLFVLACRDENFDFRAGCGFASFSLFLVFLYKILEKRLVPDERGYIDFEIFIKGTYSASYEEIKKYFDGTKNYPDLKEDLKVVKVEGLLKIHKTHIHEFVKKFKLLYLDLRI